MLAKTDQNLAEKIKQLQFDRLRHAEAIAAIDQVLGQVSDALQTVQAASDAAAGMIQVTGDAPAGEALGTRRRGRFTRTAEQSVLNFIETKVNPTTAEINRHWRSEGRKGTSNVTLLKLLNEKRIRRIEDPTVRGSRYVLTGDNPPTEAARQA